MHHGGGMIRSRGMKSFNLDFEGTVYIGKSFAASHYPAVDVGGFIEGYIDIEAPCLGDQRSLELQF